MNRCDEIMCWKGQSAVLPSPSVQNIAAQGTTHVRIILHPLRERTVTGTTRHPLRHQVATRWMTRSRGGWLGNNRRSTRLPPAGTDRGHDGVHVVSTHTHWRGDCIVGCGSSGEGGLAHTAVRNRRMDGRLGKCYPHHHGGEAIRPYCCSLPDCLQI